MAFAKNAVEMMAHHVAAKQVRRHGQRIFPEQHSPRRYRMRPVDGARAPIAEDVEAIYRAESAITNNGYLNALHGQ
jgi:hypothetical protein